MTARSQASAAVVGAGDYSSGAIERPFAHEGCRVFAGRRNGDEPAPLVNTTKVAGGQCTGLSFDARQEATVTDFLTRANTAAPLLVMIGLLLHGFSAWVELGNVSAYLAEVAAPGLWMASAGVARLIGTVGPHSGSARRTGAMREGHPV